MSDRRKRLFKRPREATEIPQDVDEEVRFHIEKKVERLTVDGMNEDEARRTALRKFGNAEGVKAAMVREQRAGLTGQVWSQLWQDTRLALRTLLNDRGFTVVAILTLAVAIGANTTIFSLVDAVLLRPLPYPDAEKLVTIGLDNPGPYEEGLGFSYTAYQHFRGENRSFEEFGAFRSEGQPLVGSGAPTQLSVGLMTNSVFTVLSVAPRRGRVPREAEDVSDGPLVAVLSNDLWTGRFSADPDVIGSTIQLDGRTREVIGIMPPDFAFPSKETDLWIPMQLDAGGSRGHLGVIGRLRGGATLQSATSDAEDLIQRFEEVGSSPEWSRLFAGRADLRTLKESVVGESRRLLLIVLGAVSFVLLIAFANVANLFLVRADGRVRQTAVRAALGATRRSLIQYSMTESVLVVLVGGVGGLVLAYIGIRLLVANGPESIPRLDGLGINTTVIWYTAGVSLMAGVIFGVLPTIQTGLGAVKAMLTDGRPASTAGGRRLNARGLLLVTQVALAVVLLIGSGLMVRSFQELRSVDLGFDPGGVVTFGLTLPEARYRSGDAKTQFFEQLLERVRGLPRVEAAGATTSLPFKGGGFRLGMAIEEFPQRPDESPPIFEIRFVTPGYFETMRIPIVSGRTVEPTDHQQWPGQLFVSAAIKEQYWPNTTALGRVFVIPAEIPGEVVGVVGDVHAMGVEAPRGQTLYLPLIWPAPYGQLTMNVAVRASGNPLDLVPQLRREVGALDPTLPLTDIGTMDDVVGESMSRTSFTMFLLVLAAFVAAFLGAVGIYGVLSYTVSQRTSELGVRMALGADSADIRSLVLGRGMTWTVIGLALGLGSAALMSRMLTSLLFETSPFDPLTFVAGPIVFAAVAVVACLVPARKAAGIDPTQALRSD